MDDLNILYLENAVSRSEYYRALGNAALLQLAEKDIHYRFSEGDNNIATLVKHISGNLISRWTDFLNTDGEKSWRNRDTEFIDDIKDLGGLFSIWNHGWDCFLSSLRELLPEDLLFITYIRKEEHTVLEALQRQLMHNTYHVGQLVFLAKSIKGDAWTSLSIPKNQSKHFNKQKGL